MFSRRQFILSTAAVGSGYLLGARPSASAYVTGETLVRAAAKRVIIRLSLIINSLLSCFLRGKFCIHYF
ncbi:hypothetical protein CBG46_08440 [Actinobacillus succinogenes]|nr:hypothetical protein CBG46_08440 [Actinobacillus succinogenes]